MSESAPPSEVPLEALPLPVPGGGTLFPGWTSGLARRDPESSIVWFFRLDSETALPRGYRDSLRQRHLQWTDLKGLSDKARTSLREEPGSPVLLTVAMPDGEALPDYLRRVSLPERDGLRLGAELLAWLRRLAGSPRLMANVAFSDFVVFARDGIQPALTFCPAPALIREEQPRGDFMIAREWLEQLAGLHAFLRQGRKGTLEPIASGGYKPFRALFKQLEAGGDCLLPDRFLAFEEFFRGEAGLSGKNGGPAAATAPMEPRHLPLGPLARFLRSKALAADPERFPPTPSSGTVPRFSPYQLDALPQGGTDRVARLLPPESWFDDSLVERLNRRLSHPFLKAHPNCLRVRSVYCDESVTLLAADAADSLPLPSLLCARDGLEPADLLLIAGKLHRALAQFDSAEFDPGLVSPWQVELHLEGGVSHPGWERLLATEVAAWPAWDLLLRLERPAESVLPGTTNESFARVRECLGGKFYPALLAWMLDWRRFQWAARTGTIANEPASWDERLATLFEAAAEHLDPTKTGQREKFLAWFEEGLVGR
jgi:hypothetical protein